MSFTLNRTQPHGEIMGTGVGGARWYQNGHSFRGDGSYCWSNPGVDPPFGVKRRSMEEADAEYQATAKKEPAPVTPPQPAPAPEESSAAPEPKPEPEPEKPVSGDLREQRLSQLSYFELAHLVSLAGGTPEKGAGALKKMVQWLMDNTVE